MKWNLKWILNIPSQLAEFFPKSESVYTSLVVPLPIEIDKANPLPHFWKESYRYKPNYASSFKNKPPQIKVTERKIVKS